MNYQPLWRKIKEWRESFAFSVIGAAFLTGVFVWQFGKLQEADRQINHTDQVIAQGIGLELLFIDCETSVRGFLLARKDDTLVPFEKANKKIPQSLEILRKLTHDKKEQAAHLTRIETLFNGWLHKAKEVLAKRRTTKADADYFAAGKGQETIDAVRIEMTSLLNFEVTERHDGNQMAKLQRKRTLVSGIALTFLLRIVLSLGYQHFRTRQEKSLAAAAATAVEAKDKGSP